MSNYTETYGPIILDDYMNIDTPDENSRLALRTTDAINDLLTLAYHERTGQPAGYCTQADMYADAAQHAHDLAYALDILTSQAHEAGMKSAE
ncbi:hypothetical protein BJF89_08730 [Corynebacterium sp. CNJ-954]|uniref:hypothetical protein n=1 Tax=Corynebacterium sp. CNJ-954 TaxID=1904962 RepID=UPI0009677F5F|nr:hypothetical protein [Corynebacterium sp. CNJ-954]OLT51185.1 hypothetical protein BJF89_08730 [Corynebacterium sp. CNJ-954]